MLILAWLVWLAFQPGRAIAREARVGVGDLLLVRARLRDCPDRLRLVEVERVQREPIRLLDLGPFAVVGRSSSAVLGDIRARYRQRLGVRAAPPIALEILPSADSRFEVVLLQQSLRELDCDGFAPYPNGAPDFPKRAVLDRIARR